MKMNKTTALSLSAALALTLCAAPAFAEKKEVKADTVAAEKTDAKTKEMKCGEGTCGGKMKKDAKAKEDAKSATTKPTTQPAEKAKEAKCGEKMKTKEGKCGKEGMKKEEAKKEEVKKVEVKKETKKEEKK